MNRQERKESEEENRIDRRKISRNSVRKLAESVHHEDPISFEEKVFSVLTGEDVEDWEPWRNVKGVVELSTAVADELTSDQELIVEVSVGADTQAARVDTDSVGAYRVRELADGEYDVGVIEVEGREWNEDNLESTEIEVIDYEISLEAAVVTVDSASTPIDEDVTGPTVEVTNIELEDTE